MELANDITEDIKKRTVEDLAATSTVEEEMKAKNYTKEDAIWRVVGKATCRPSALQLWRVFSP
jgi:hypothetical protein